MTYVFSFEVTCSIKNSDIGIPLGASNFALGWGLGGLSHGLNARDVFVFLGPELEKKKIEKKLGKKL